uniref:C-C motif chemokine ligand 21 n=1 Tax=Sus scrofa TaxID=9823 RepID=A0A4X1UR03_PIG
MAQSLVLRILVLVLAFCIPHTQGSDGGAQDCCLKYSLRKIPTHVVRSYRKQEPSLGCPIPAILFSPRKRSQPELCADPQKAWVQELMRHLDKPPVPRTQAQDCKKDKRASKSGKKGKGSKGCKSTAAHITPGLERQRRQSPPGSMRGSSRTVPSEERSPRALDLTLLPTVPHLFFVNMTYT